MSPRLSRQEARYRRVSNAVFSGDRHNTKAARVLVSNLPNQNVCKHRASVALAALMIAKHGDGMVDVLLLGTPLQIVHSIVGADSVLVVHVWVGEWIGQKREADKTVDQVSNSYAAIPQGNGEIATTSGVCGEYESLSCVGACSVRSHAPKTGNRVQALESDNRTPLLCPTLFDSHACSFQHRGKGRAAFTRCCFGPSHCSTKSTSNHGLTAWKAHKEATDAKGATDE